MKGVRADVYKLKNEMLIFLRQKETAIFMNNLAGNLVLPNWCFRQK
jgi:hypothetical protein